MQDSNKRTEGAALLLAIMMMAALIGFGVAYVDVSTSQAAVQDTALEKLRASALAEAGIAIAHDRLVQNPSFRGPLTGNLGGGSYDVSFQTSGQTLTIESTGNGDCVSSGYRSTLTMETTASLRGALHVGGTVGATNGSIVHWGGTLTSPNTPVTDGSILKGDSEIVSGGETASIDVDIATVVASATTVLGDDGKGNAVMPGADYDGYVVANGNVTLSGDVQVRGTLVVNGNLTVTGETTTLSLQQTSSPTVLLVTGNLDLRNIHRLAIYGVVYVEGNVTFEDVPSANAFGALVANGNVDFRNSNVTWEFDPETAEKAAHAINGMQSTTHFVEVSRVPFLVDPPESESEGESEGGEAMMEGSKAPKK